MHPNRSVIAACSLALMVGLLAAHCCGADSLPLDRSIDFSGQSSQTVELTAGQTVEIGVGFRTPSQFPDNGRIAIEWTGPDANSSWRKVLHALDPDVYLVYRAPRSGPYTLS